MLAAIFYTHSLIEMIVWAAITRLVQLGVLLALHVRQSVSKMDMCARQ
jgi:hypothetical protein